MNSASQSTSRILIPSKPTNPLSPSLRASISSLLVEEKKVSELRKAISAHTGDTAWSYQVRQRVMQLLESGETTDTQHLREIIIAEALGRPAPRNTTSDTGEEDDEEEQGHSPQPTVNGKGKGKEKEHTERHEGDSQKNTARPDKVDIRVPQSAIDAGTRILRTTLEKHADLRPESKEEREWNDWR